MKAVIQVVQKAVLSVENKVVSEIGKGLVVFFCVEKGDDDEKVKFFSKKIANLRIFDDENGKTNLSVLDIGGEILLVSQFTLAGQTAHGNRPSFENAELPERAKFMYEKLANLLKEDYSVVAKLGVFGANMQIMQVNDGPFTVLVEK